MPAVRKYDEKNRDDRRREIGSLSGIHQDAAMACGLNLSCVDAKDGEAEKSMSGWAGFLGAGVFGDRG